MAAKISSAVFLRIQAMTRFIPSLVTCPYVFRPKILSNYFWQGKVAAGVCPAGAILEWLCGFGSWGVVEGDVAEHGEEHVAAAPGEGDQGLIVALPFCSLPVAVGP